MTDPTQPNRLSTPPVKRQLSLDERLKRARESFEKSFKAFHELLKSKILKSNLSEAQKKLEKHTIDGLVKACVHTDQLNMGEGVMAMAVVALREHLTVRNRINELEYQLSENQKEIRLLKRELGIEDDKTK